MLKRMMLIVFLGMTVFFDSPAFAHSMDHGQSQCPVANKFMMKAHFLLENKAELGLSEDQVKTIKALKLQMAKDNIRQGADMQTFMLDLNSSLSEDKVDVEGTNVLIDKGFASAMAAAKSNLDAYAKLKGLLTPEQITKMKALHEKMEMKEKEEEAEGGK